MKIVRSSVFETNSSSTHALVVALNPDKDNYDLYDSLNHQYTFGREESRLVYHWDEKLAYTYYVLKSFSTSENRKDSLVSDEQLEAFKQTVTDIYDNLAKKEEIYDSDPTPLELFTLTDIAIDGSCSWDKPDELVVKMQDGSFKVIKALIKDVRIYIDREDNIMFRYYKNREQKSREPEDSEYEIVDASYKDIVKYKFSNKDVYVDHIEDFKDNGFIDKVLNSGKQYIKNFIFNSDSYITVGGDEYRGYNIKTIGFEYDYDSSKQYLVNEKGERCPERESFPDTDEGWDQWWQVRSRYPITRDDGGFYDKLAEYEKDHDVFLKGN